MYVGCLQISCFSELKITGRVWVKCKRACQQSPQSLRSREAAEELAVAVPEASRAQRSSDSQNLGASTGELLRLGCISLYIIAVSALARWQKYFGNMCFFRSMKLYSRLMNVYYRSFIRIMNFILQELWLFQLSLSFITRLLLG